MRIGICTLHYAHNYGAMLQAFALKTYLEGLGHHVFMVDRRTIDLTVWKPKPIRGLSFKSLVLYPKYLVKWYLPGYVIKRRRERRFESFKKKYLENRFSPSNESLDAIIYGSDQIWSKFINGYDDIFWGLKNSNTNKRIAYGASMGVVEINDEDEVYLKEALSRFSAISVREKDLQEMLIERRLVRNVEVKRVIDPTFLIESDRWISLNKKRVIKEPYLLFYDFQIDDKTTELARLIAKKKRLRMIRLTDGVVNVEKNRDYLVTAGPLEFISLFFYADFVVSSSFHGTAFAIINRKQFYVRQVWNKERVRSLLSSLGLNNRFIEDVDKVNLEDRIDYRKVKDIILQKCNDSEMFLQKALLS